MTPPSNDLRATRVFTEALELPPGERPRFLDGACAGDAAFRAKVEALLEVFPRAESLFRQLGGAADAAAGEVAPEERASDRTTEAPRTAATVTNRIGRYRILEKIGEGGFGEVFIAQQTEPVKRRVALKVLKAGMDTKSVLARFEAERQALAMMDHPNIAKVLDAGETEQGRPYFVMDLVEGEPITAYSDRHTLSTKERLELFMPVCRAVQHAHQKGIIHRDIKPSNILVMLTDGKPTPKVIDFGIAKAASASLTDKTLHTMQGQLIGTPAYMSPEQAEMGALDVDTRTDIYSLGVVLYELLAGSLPFDPESLRKAGFAEIQRILRQEDPPKPSTKVSTLGEHSTEVAKRRHTDVRTLRRQLRGELDWITLRAMEKDRTRRYETPNSLAMDIGRYLTDEPVIAGPPSATYRARKFAKRNKVALGVMVAILVAVAAWAVQSEIQKKKIEAARDESEAVTEFLAEMLSSVDPAEQGKDVTVREIMDEAAETIQERFGDQPLVEAHLRHTMGSTYHALGELKVAEAQLERAIEIRHRLLGKEDLLTLESAHHLASVYLSQFRFDEAESLNNEVLEARRRVLGEEHPETLRSMYLLATIYGNQGQSAEAESLLLPILEISRRVLGEEHPRTLERMVYLALVSRDQRRFDEAESLLVETLETQRRVLGREHPQTLTSMGALATVFETKNLYEEAESLYLQALEATRRKLGDEHPETLHWKGNLAHVYVSQARYDEAESLMVEVLEARRRVLGNDHLMTLGSLIALAFLFQNVGSYDKAEPLIRETLETSRRTLGEEHPRTLDAICRLAVSYQRQGRTDEAERLLVPLLETERRVLGEEDGNTLGTMHYLALVYQDQSRYEEAASLLAQKFDTQRRVLGKEHPSTLATMNDLAPLYQHEGRSEDAESLYRQALEGRRRVLGQHHPLTLQTMNLLLDLYNATDKLNEARALAVEVVALEKQAAEGPQASAMAKNRYAWILLTCQPSDLRDPEEALRFALAANEQTGYANFSWLHTLALAYHLNGLEAEAIETQRRAIALLPDGSTENPLRVDFEATLDEYEAAMKRVVR